VPEKWYGCRNAGFCPNFTNPFDARQVQGRFIPITAKKRGVKIRPQRIKRVGLFAGQKWCISGNPGNTLSGHHLSVGNPSVCSPGIPCQVLWSGMLGLGRDRQRQLRFSKAMDSNFTACPHHSGMQTAFLVHKLQKLLFGVLSDALASLHPSRDI